MIRNKKMHYRELPGEIQKRLGTIPGTFLGYFDERYPRLMVVLYVFAATHLPRAGASGFFAARSK